MTRVLVVGGGITGCAVAATCARRGMRVTLCERYALASGSSDLELALIPAALDASAYLELHLFTGRAFLLDRTPPDEWPARRIDPRAAAAAYAADARAHGASVRTGSDVKAFLCAGDAVRGALTDAGELDADAVVVAAGSGSRRLCASAGIPLPGPPSEAGLLVCEPGPGQEEAPVLDGDAWQALDEAGRLVVARPSPAHAAALDVVEERVVAEASGPCGESPARGLYLAVGAGPWGVARAPMLATTIAERIADG